MGKREWKGCLYGVLAVRNLIYVSQNGGGDEERIPLVSRY